jgi:hypothetical protein
VENAEGQEEVVVVQDDTNSEEGEFEDAEAMPTVQVSMHALVGIPSMAHTFTLKLQMGNQVATTLVDSGSDISFISDRFAVKAKCNITTVEGVKVTAANG